VKLLRYGQPGSEKPGILDQNGALRDLGDHVADINGDTINPRGLAALAKLDVETLPIVNGAPRIGACVNGVGKFVCIGLNYSDHAKEAAMALPTEPMMFLKATSAICGPNDDLEKPVGATALDWEVELGVVIGTRAKRVSEDAALDHVAGYCVVNDASERTFQLHRQGQMTKGKSHDTFGPIGPWLVTKDEVPDPQALSLSTVVDGETMQNGTTSTMVYPVRMLVSYLSQFMTLQPGDIIATGTPAGVGMGKKPTPIYLSEGQVITLSVDRLGQQRHRVVGA